MKRDGFAAQLTQAFVIFLTGGFIYGAIEILYRGHTHPSMFVLGGICLLWVGSFSALPSHPLPLWLQVLLGGVFITLAEFFCGLVYNVWLGLRIWDYSKLPLNIMGQVCPMFFFAWTALALPAILIHALLCRAFDRDAQTPATTR